MKRDELIKYNHWLWKQRFGEMVQTIGMDGIADKYLSTLPDEINYKQKYEEIVNSDWFKKAYENRPIGDAITLPDEKEYCKCKDLNAVNRICRRCKKIVPIRQYERSKSNQP